MVPWLMINRINYISLSASNYDLWHCTLCTDEEIGAFDSCVFVGLIIKCIYDTNIYDYDTFILWQVLYPIRLVDLVWINRTHNKWMNENIQRGNTL